MVHNFFSSREIYLRVKVSLLRSFALEISLCAHSGLSRRHSSGTAHARRGHLLRAPGRGRGDGVTGRDVSARALCTGREKKPLYMRRLNRVSISHTP